MIARRIVREGPGTRNPLRDAMRAGWPRRDVRPAGINRHTGEPHADARAIARRMAQREAVRVLETARQREARA